MKSQTGIAQHIFSFSLSSALLLVLSGAFRLWDHHSGLALGRGGFAAAGCLAAALIAALAARRRREVLVLTVLGSAAVLPLVYFSDWLTRPYSFYPGLAVRGEILLFAVLSFWLLARCERCVPILALLAPLFLLWWFFSFVGMRQLVSDDHSSVFFRLQMLKENFPDIPHYLPLWNGGIEWRDFFGTGILNMFLLMWPLIEALPLAQSYTLLVALVAFVALPLSVYWGARVLNLERLAASFAALLALSFSLVWYRWVFKYGAMGFVTSAALLPVAFCLALRFVERRGKEQLGSCLLLVLVASLTVFWPLMGLLFVPVALTALPQLPALMRRWQFWVVLMLFVTINLPWGVLFWKVSKVDKFITLGEEGDALSGHGSQIGAAAPGRDEHWDPTLAASGSRSVQFQSAIKKLREAASSTNPLIFVLALPGLALLAARRARIAFILLLMEGLLLGTVVSQLKPQYELERMLLMAFLLFCIPAGAASAALLKQAQQAGSATGTKLLAALNLGFMLCGILVSAWIVQNRSYERFGLSTGSGARLARLIAEHAGEGRTAFTGFVLHEVDGGHIAPLIFASGKPLLASAPTHSRWSYTELVPEEYKSRGVSGDEEYFELMDVSLVAAHEQGWRALLEGRPDLYSKVGGVGAFTLYRRNNWRPSYFLSGQGQIVSQDTGKVVVRMESEEAVLKFNYLPFLVASTCQISPQLVGSSISLIKISGCAAGTELSIAAAKPWERLS